MWRKGEVHELLDVAWRVARCQAALCIVAVALIGTLTNGCASSGPSPSQPIRSAIETLAALPSEIADAIDIRTKLGMRADVEFVRELAADPAMVAIGERSGYGVPMTEAELTELQRRTANLHEIATIGHAYGLRHPDDFAGDYIDQENHRYVFLVSGRLEEHRAALIAELPFASPVVVELAESSLESLDVLRERVQRDEAFLRSIGARFIGLGVIEKDNVVELTVGSDDDSTEARILEHFGNPPRLRVRIVAGGIAQNGYGTLIVQLVDAAGEPVTPRNVLCQLADAESGRTLNDELVPTNARCRYTHVPAGDIDARIIRDGGDRRILAHERGAVTAGDEVAIRVTLAR